MHILLPRLSLIVLIILFSLIGCSREGDGQQAEDYLKRAEIYRDQGQYRAALIEVTNAINSAPEDPRYAVSMAEIYTTLGAAKRASDLLEGYLPQAPQVVALALADAYLQQGKFLSAEEALAQFTPGEEEDAWRHAMYRADAQRMRGRLEGSEASYRELLQTHPDNLDLALRLGQTLLQQGRSEAAAEHLTDLRNAHPEEAEVYYLSALLALRESDRDRAERHLTQALAHTPQTDLMLPERALILRTLSETLTAQGRTSEALIYNKILAEESPETIEAQQRLREATLAAESGDYEQAETLLTRLLSDNPDSQSATLLLGMVNLSQGNLSEAEALLSRSVDVETADTDVIRATVMAQAEVGNLEQALATLERSLEVRPDDPILLSIYGMLALNQPEAEEKGYLSLQKALARDPHRGGVRLALARYHLQKNEPEQAMAQLRAAFSYQPADWPVTNVYMDLLFARGDMAEIAQALEQLKQAAPKAKETALFDAQYQFRNNTPQQGVEQLRALLRSEPTYTRGHAVLAQMYRETGNEAAALETVERLAKLEPGNLQVLRAGLDIIASRPQLGPPHDWLQGLENHSPELKSSSQAVRALLYRDAGEYQRAVELIRSLPPESGDEILEIKAQVFRDGARALAGNEQYSEARSLLMEALERTPTNKALNMDLVQLDVAQGRHEQARILLDDLKARHPDDPEVVVLNARAMQVMEGSAAAYRELSQAWGEQPSSVIAVPLLALARQEEPEAVPGILEAWEQADPQNRGRMLYMADQYQRQGDETAAITTYETLLVNEPNDPVALNNLAWLLKDRDLTRARELAARAVRLQPNAPAILDTYGWLLYLSGERNEALKQLERALELAPNATEIQKNLETVRRG
jgi:Tfp pilus assembly protein PilF